MYASAQTVHSDYILFTNSAKLEHPVFIQPLTVYGGTIFLLRIECENEVFFIWSVIRTQYFRRTENRGKLQLTQRRVRLPFISVVIKRMASARVVVK